MDQRFNRAEFEQSLKAALEFESIFKALKNILGPFFDNWRYSKAIGENEADPSKVEFKQADPRQIIILREYLKICLALYCDVSKFFAGQGTLLEREQALGQYLLKEGPKTKFYKGLGYGIDIDVITLDQMQLQEFYSFGKPAKNGNGLKLVLNEVNKIQGGLDLKKFDQAELFKKIDSEYNFYTLCELVFIKRNIENYYSLHKFFDGTRYELDELKVLKNFIQLFLTTFECYTQFYSKETAIDIYKWALEFTESAQDEIAQRELDEEGEE